MFRFPFDAWGDAWPSSRVVPPANMDISFPERIRPYLARASQKACKIVARWESNFAQLSVITRLLASASSRATSACTARLSKSRRMTWADSRSSHSVVFENFFQLSTLRRIAKKVGLKPNSQTPPAVAFPYPHLASQAHPQQPPTNSPGPQT